MKYFTADTHWGENRIGIDGRPNLFYRPFLNVRHQDQAILDGFIFSDFVDGDELWHLGDVLYDVNSEWYLEQLRGKYPNSKFNLVVGNYDEDKLDLLGNYFDNMYESYTMTDLVQGSAVYLNHYPTKCLPQIGYELSPNYKIDFAITGHIHGLWKVQPNMVNVGVDAWHFKPVSETEIDFCMNACKKFYDKNVFPYSS